MVVQRDGCKLDLEVVGAATDFEAVSVVGRNWPAGREKFVRTSAVVVAAAADVDFVDAVSAQMTVAAAG